MTKGRTNLGSVANRVHLNKEYIILEKDGILVAGLMDIDEFEDYLELQDPEVRGHIQKSSEDYHAGKSRPMEDFVAKINSSKGRRPKTARRQKT